MAARSANISYRGTGYFPDLVMDYIEGSSSVQPFYHLPPDLPGFAESIRHRSKYPINREKLVHHLLDQYKLIQPDAEMLAQLSSLKDDKTFTVTTAHQPNLFTGPAYFIYKIIHAIKLSTELKQQFPEYHFVPVYYMGNEDADFDELGHCRIMGERYSWETGQTGAFGKMLVDEGVIDQLKQLSSLLPVYPHGEEAIHLLKDAFQKGRSIQEATFWLVHQLFSKNGLVVLIADSKELKAQFNSIVEDELINHNAQKIVQKTIEKLNPQYSIQTGVREINLFYLKDARRERIEKDGEGWKVVNTTIHFSKDELLQELAQFPERFSPNVILRPLYQEMILPNIAFVGGAGELSYWLELKELFHFYQLPFPVLLLRQSFLLVKEEAEKKINKHGFEVNDFFHPTSVLLNQYVKKHAEVQTGLEEELNELQKLYETISLKAAQVDTGLKNHVHALHRNAEKKLQTLVKKMERAGRRRFSDEQRRIEKIRQELFPAGSLQERSESIWTFYAIYGRHMLDELLQQTEAFKHEWKTIVLS